MGNRLLKKMGRNIAIAGLLGGVTFLAPPVQAEKMDDVLKLKQTRICFRCDLKRADLENASLAGAFLRKSNLKGANLEGADLRFAFIRNVNLKKANLTNADLTGAILRDVNLDGAILTGARLPLNYGGRPNPSQEFRMPDPKKQLPQFPKRSF
ncbi:pentapeptide repeat-containing protein [Acaryochloris sp. IP29b_bin.137]|uniref:pentapeptide repeat-containing protein n=1 Tax=Acaryochloris sp. IP29b_bin.137 TaxID=2969217 RepID=UPI002601BB4B|nr:pentapeptide repeat-containing protein [Acaryochloris sp. IP29b_bin.137]